YGVIGQRQYLLYDGIVPLSELLADTCNLASGNLLVFGDTMCGTCHGFDPSRAMQVIAIDLDTHEVEPVASTFELFIRMLLMSFIEMRPVQNNDSDGP